LNYPNQSTTGAVLRTIALMANVPTGM